MEDLKDVLITIATQKNEQDENFERCSLPLREQLQVEGKSSV